MNNFSLKLKKILNNKNVVTAVAFILIAIILIFAYNYRLKKATNPINVPYALVTIEPQTRITADMIGTLSIARDAVNAEYVVTDASLIIGRYTNLESTIYQGSLFYASALSEKDQLPTAALLDVPDTHTLLSLPVDMVSSFYNSLVPGDYFDLYVRTIDESSEDEIIVGKLIDKIKILAVKTENGENVFGSSESRLPAGVIFSLPEEQALLMMKAEYFTNLSDAASIQFVIIPRGTKYEAQNGETVESTITSQQLQDYINDKTKDIDVNEIKNNTELGE